MLREFRARETAYWESLIERERSNPRRLWSSLSDVLGRSTSHDSPSQSPFTAEDFLDFSHIFSSRVTINMTLSDKASCFANTSQSCSYTWKRFNGYDWIDMSNGQILKPKEVGRHRCEATCAMRNKSCTLEPVYAEVYSIPDTNEKNLLALLVLFVLPVGLISLFVAIYLRKKKRLNEERRQKEELQLNEREALPEKYISDPVLVQIIKTELKTSITGFTILDAELFVVNENSSEVQVYNSVNFSFSRRWKLKELINPADIASCNINKCLYIREFNEHCGPSNEILRVDPNGKLIIKWPTEGGWGLGLSVTDESNVLFAASTNNKHKLNEYSPDGRLVCEINLSSDAGTFYLFHAIKLANGHFLVTRFGDLPGVCVVDADGNLKKSFDGNCGPTIPHLRRPTYLAVDGNGFVMVVDKTNDRVLLLDSELGFKRELLSPKKHRFRYGPWKILLDQTTNQLLVTDNLDFLIFSLPREK